MPRKSGDRELSPFSRGRLVGLIEAGMSQRSVAARLECSQGTVSLQWNQWQSSGHCISKPREGRPRVTTVRDDRRIRVAIIRNRFTSYRLLRASIHLSVSRQTVNRRAVEMGYRSRRPLVCVPLTVPQRYLRLKWCRSRQQEQITYWRTIIFSNESRFKVESADGRVRVHKRNNERYLQECIRKHDSHGRGGVMVWAAIGYNCKSRLLFIDGSLNSAHYIQQVLELEAVPLMLELPGRAFQQDNARCHTARARLWPTWT
jgi:hypothetical protein